MDSPTAGKQLTNQQQHRFNNNMPTVGLWHPKWHATLTVTHIRTLFDKPCFVSVTLGTEMTQKPIQTFLNPEGGSQKATLVVLVGISSLKIPKVFLIRSGAQRNFVHTFVLTFHTDLPSQIFHLFLSKFVSCYQFKTWHRTFTTILPAQGV